MSLNARLAKVEQALMPATSYLPYVMGLMHFGDGGRCSKLKLVDQVFTPQAGETEEQLRDRAMLETDKADHNLILVRFVRAENGKPAPGFERFARP